MTAINAYINFNGKCREAMTFYQECLGGDLNFMTVEGSPIEPQCPPAIKHYILHSSLSKGAMVLMATDMTAPSGYTHGNSVSLSVNCSSEEEIRTLYEKLSAEGKTIDPLNETFWGALFGVFDDKYGTRWMLNYEKPRQ